MARNDLTESEINHVKRRAQMVVDENFVWQLTKREADQVQRLAGEVLRLRDTEAQVRHFEGQEQEW
jgi:hypothetical protein